MSGFQLSIQAGEFVPTTSSSNDVISNQKSNDYPYDEDEANLALIEQELYGGQSPYGQDQHLESSTDNYDYNGGNVAINDLNLMSELEKDIQDEETRVYKSNLSSNEHNHVLQTTWFPESRNCKTCEGFKYAAQFKSGHCPDCASDTPSEIGPPDADNRNKPQQTYAASVNQEHHSSSHSAQRVNEGIIRSTGYIVEEDTRFETNRQSSPRNNFSNPPVRTAYTIEESTPQTMEYYQNQYINYPPNGGYYVQQNSARDNRNYSSQPRYNSHGNQQVYGQSNQYPPNQMYHQGGNQNYSNANYGQYYQGDRDPQRGRGDGGRPGGV